MTDKRGCAGPHMWSGWELWKAYGRSFFVRTCRWCGAEERA
jgi:hypothetical protein